MFFFNIFVKKGVFKGEDEPEGSILWRLAFIFLTQDTGRLHLDRH